MLDFDSTWLPEDDTLFSNIEQSSWLDQSPFSFDQSLLPLDPSGSPFDSAQPAENFVLSSTNNDLDTSDVLFGDIDSGLPISSGTDKNEPNFFFLDDDNSFQLADCSISGSLLPIFDKSRVRRRDGEKCMDPATRPSINSGPTFPEDDFDPIRELLESPEMTDKVIIAKENEYNNVPCHVLTKGQFPLGVCSSDGILNRYLLRGSLVTGALRLAKWRLSGGTLGMFCNNFMKSFHYSIDDETNIFSNTFFWSIVSGLQLICPDPTQQFYCCKDYSLVTRVATPCVLLSELMLTVMWLRSYNGQGETSLIEMIGIRTRERKSSHLLPQCCPLLPALLNQCSPCSLSPPLCPLTALSCSALLPCRSLTCMIEVVLLQPRA